MKIKSIETFSTPNICITRVRTDDGHEGMGQIAPYYANISAQVLHQQIAHQAQFMELSIESNPWTNDLYMEKLVVRDGKVSIPDGPGWGITIRPEWLEKADYEISQI